MKIAVATPVRGAEPMAAQVYVGYSESLRQLSKELPVEQLPAHLTFSADIVRGRNRLAHLILSSPEFADITHVLWWDDDVWPDDRSIVREMVESGHDLVAAPYTNKRQPMHWVMQQEPGAEQEGPFLPVRGVGFGFTITSRACLQRMSEHPDTTHYYDLPKPHRVANIFGHIYDSMPGPTGSPVQVLLSEDYAFCKRWRDYCGGRVMVYLKAGVLNHSGSHAWSAREMPGGIRAA